MIKIVGYLNFLAFIVIVVFILSGRASAQPDNQITIICPKCNYENSFLSSFCINCGNSLKEVKEAYNKSKQNVTAVSIPDSNTAKASKKSTVRNESPIPPRKKERFPKIRIPYPLDPPRLFNIPTAEVLGSLDLNLTGGGTFGMEKERTFLGKIGIGLGDIAEMELSTLGLINALKSGITTIASSAFKLKFWEERKNLPGLAMALGGTPTWNELAGDDPTVSFETRLMKLYLVATKRKGRFGGHFGVTITDVRVKNNPLGWKFKNPQNDQLKKNLYAIFCGTDIKANPKTKIMIELETVPKFEFQKGGIYDNSAMTSVWSGMIGVRFFFTNWLAIDTGVRYQSDFDGIADSKIQASLNVFLPLKQMVQEQQPTNEPSQ